MPTSQLQHLTDYAKGHGLSRAEAVRQAVDSYLSASRKPLSSFIGLWAREGSHEDGLAYQDRMREEW
jgi:hypothetical protein